LPPRILRLHAAFSILARKSEATRDLTENKLMRDVGVRPNARTRQLLRRLARPGVSLRNVLFDLRFGAVLGGGQSRSGPNDPYFGNSPYEVLEPLFSAAGIRLDDVVVDVGCGKGRVINWPLRFHPHNRVIGIELDPGVAVRTARRLRRYKHVRIVCGDVRENIPPEGSLFYLYNPFDADTMRGFIDALAAKSHAAHEVRLMSCAALANATKASFTPLARRSGERIRLGSISHQDSPYCRPVPVLH
jgi:SAM-dependent methyltransferase